MYVLHLAFGFAVLVMLGEGWWPLLWVSMLIVVKLASRNPSYASPKVELPLIPIVAVVSYVFVFALVPDSWISPGGNALPARLVLVGNIVGIVLAIASDFVERGRGPLDRNVTVETTEKRE
jgi:hypothetical protein